MRRFLLDIGIIAGASCSLRLASDLGICRSLRRISTDMKRLGLTIGQIDRLIAGIAFSLPNCTVVSADTDMLRVPGLPVENWLLT